MHLLLTDKLCCPRCGPRFGLILRADETGPERRVLRGRLGCPNCRDGYPIEKGFGDLRTPPRTEVEAEALPYVEDRDDALPVAAGLGLREGPAQVVLVDGAARYASALTRLLAGVEFLALSAGLRERNEEPGVSRAVTRGGTIPLYDGVARGVVLQASSAPAVAEALRVLAPRSRLVVLGADAAARRAVEEAPLNLLLDEDGTLVAERG